MVSLARQKSKFLYRFCVLSLLLSLAFSMESHATQFDRAEVFDGWDRVALVIGFDDFDHWPDLRGVTTDVSVVSAQLTELGFTVRQFPFAQKRTSSKTKMKEELRSWLRTHLKGQNAPSGSKTQLLVYFAGHGQSAYDDENNLTGYLVMPESPVYRAGQDRQFTESAMTVKEIVHDWMSDLTVQHALFVFDACFSGSILQEMDRLREKKRGQLGFDDGSDQTSEQKYLNALKSKTYQAILTSGSADQLVPDQSIFRRYFVNALQGYGDSDNNGIITGTEIGEFVRAQVISNSTSNQTPRFGYVHKSHYEGDFVFINGLAPSERTGTSLKQAIQEEKLTLRQKRAALEGQEFIDCVDCPILLRFLRSPARKSAPKVDGYRTRSWAIGQSEVTFDEWDACFKDSFCRQYPTSNGWERGRRPVINVGVQDAQNYLDWLNERVTQELRDCSVGNCDLEFNLAEIEPQDAIIRYRLPTTEELSALGERFYPNITNNSDEGRSPFNCRNCGHPEYDNKKTATVGTFSLQRNAPFDLFGNVWEWTLNCTNKVGQNTPYNNTDFASLDVKQTEHCDLFGGSYLTRFGETPLMRLFGTRQPPLIKTLPVYTQRADHRSDALAFRNWRQTRDKNIGFRVVREVLVANQ